MTVSRLIALALLPLQAGVVTWPAVNPVARRFRVDLASERIVVDLPIADHTGRVVYHFACRGGSEAYLDSLPGNWVGPLMCTLALGDTASEQSLLSEDDSSSWFSRGQFRAEDLTGDCAKYPEFGVRRSFRLRGLHLDLEAQNVVTDQNGSVQSFTLAVSVASDSNAVGEQAERPGFLDPHRQGRTGKVVVPGREPRMCRDWNTAGSWAPCKN